MPACNPSWLHPYRSPILRTAATIDGQTFSFGQVVDQNMQPIYEPNVRAHAHGCPAANEQRPLVQLDICTPQHAG